MGCHVQAIKSWLVGVIGFDWFGCSSWVAAGVGSFDGFGRHSIGPPASWFDWFGRGWDCSYDLGTRVSFVLLSFFCSFIIFFPKALQIRSNYSD